MVFAHFGAGRYPESAVWGRKLIDKQPENIMANYLLVAAAALQKDSAAAAETLATLLRLRPDFSLKRVMGNTPLTGDLAASIVKGLRSAGVPE